MPRVQKFDGLRFIAATVANRITLRMDPGADSAEMKSGRMVTVRMIQRNTPTQIRAAVIAMMRTMYDYEDQEVKGFYLFIFSCGLAYTLHAIFLN